MNYQELVTLITLFFLLVAAINLTRYRRKYQSSTNELFNLRKEKKLLFEQCDELKAKLDNQISFAHSLSEAELTTKLQSSRTNFHSPFQNSSPPEKYSYISSLSSSGMDTDKIAALLSISLQEAEQLVTLAHISNR